MYNKRDRRLFERAQGALIVRYKLQGSSKEYCTTAKNMSGGGMEILLLERLEPGTGLEIEIFKDKSNISATCRGEIIWVYGIDREGKRKQSFEAGIKFIDLKFLYIGSLISDLETRNKTAQLS